MTEDVLFICHGLRMSDANIWSEEWGEQGEDWSGGGGRHKRLPRAAERPGLGATVGELDPGNFVVYHFHHAWEELLVVLRGRPTLRTPAGERQLDEGEAVYFPLGADGAAAKRHRSTGPLPDGVDHLVARGVRVPRPEADHRTGPDGLDDRRAALADPRRRGGSMNEREDTGTVVELLLREPEIVAWLDDRRRPEPDEAPDDDEPPRAA